MTIAELVIAEARNRNLRHFFGIPGGGSPLDLMEAGRKMGVDFISVNHESSAAIMAAYYGLMKGTPGLALTIRGVGAANLVGGAANVHFERVPMVAICETCPPESAKYRMAQHCDQLSLFSGIERYRQTLSTENAPLSVQEAVFFAEDGRPGPSLLNFPANLGEAACGMPLPSRSKTPSSSLKESEIIACKEFLSNHEKLVVMAGADVDRENACKELVDLVENLNASVLVTMEARGVFPESHKNWAGVYVGQFTPGIVESRVFDECDAVLLVGVDDLMTHVPWNSSLPTVELLGRSEYRSLSQQPSVRVNGNLKDALKSLLPQPREGFNPDKIQGLREKILSSFKRPSNARFTAQDIIKITQEVLPSDGILFSETGVFVCMLEHLWCVDQPGTYFGTSGGRTMGLTIPAICGAKLAEPNRPMIGLGGDGSLLMRLGELEVLARTGVAVPLIIMNDQALGTMKARQKLRNLESHGLDLHPICFEDLAKSFGLNGVTVNNPEDFEVALKKSLKSEHTTLIDARIDPEIYQDSFGRTVGMS